MTHFPPLKSWALAKDLISFMCLLIKGLTNSISIIRASSFLWNIPNHHPFRNARRILVWSRYDLHKRVKSPVYFASNFPCKTQSEFETIVFTSLSINSSSEFYQTIPFWIRPIQAFRHSVLSCRTDRENTTTHNSQDLLTGKFCLTMNHYHQQ